MRIVTDTNVVASAFLWGGTPAILLAAARQGRAGLYTSAALIAELEDILSRPKFARQFARVGSSPARMVGDYLALAQLVRLEGVPRVVAADADDDHVIACALAAQAQIIVSGDRHLLSLGSHQGIAILTAAQAVERIGSAA